MEDTGGPEDYGTCHRGSLAHFESIASWSKIALISTSAGSADEMGPAVVEVSKRCTLPALTRALVYKSFLGWIASVEL